MGVISGEELMQWEKMQGRAHEEKIFVSVRLRPLNEKEIARNDESEWECINDNTIIFRNSLSERSMFPTAHSFDRVFRGDCSTKQVYEEGAKEVALLVVSGINSSIFAYGQTSSGKTYTMSGITEYTIADIYDYIQRHEERAFVLKFSAMEIYNEAVRDLLSADSMPLRLLDDPERGTIVEKLTEEILINWNHFRHLLSICDAQRQVGETSLNETSSRSHQIVRLTVESSAREFLGKDNSSTLAACVNFVDLAGSERASQALSAGARLKEGCHINRSLLTLGTVIRKLSKVRNGHIPYRDSKLTRILQPSLGGNARTAIICTMCSARSHVEQSRNTLLFASCAKEVATNAKVNVVMSDKALVKHLQRELARLESELRIPGPTTAPRDYAALLRQKDLQIEKMEREIKELTQQRDLAQHRLENLLQVVDDNQASRIWEGPDQNPRSQAQNGWADEHSLSESSDMADHHYPDVDATKFKPPQHSDIHGGSNYDDNYQKSPENPEVHFPSEDLYKDVPCIEMEDSSISKNVENEGILALTPTRNGDATNNLTDFTYGALEQKFQDMQKTIESLVTPYSNEPSPWPLEEDLSRSTNFQLTRSRSCRATLMSGSNTPLNWFHKDFPGRPERFGRKFSILNFDDNIERLSRNDSRAFDECVSTDGRDANNIEASTEEDITSIHTFVAGLKEMAKIQYENQLGDGQAQGTESKGSESRKMVKDVGLDPIQDPLESTSKCPIDFQMQQGEIIELWHTCNVSLVHRTYFFLLFKGDPSDSIYMEVELRRLSFIKNTFSQEILHKQVVKDGQTPTPASSMRALRREREMLAKRMQKRLSEEERERLYEKWGIDLDSKQRRLQLARCLWTDTKDMDHIIESANVVARLIGFVEPGQALKEMFGLSFTPRSTRRRSYRLKRSIPLL